MFRRIEARLKAYVDERYQSNLTKMKIEIDSKIAALNDEVNIIIRRYTEAGEKLAKENTEKQAAHIARTDEAVQLIKGYLETLNKILK